MHEAASGAAHLWVGRRICRRVALGVSAQRELTRRIDGHSDFCYSDSGLRVPGFPMRQVLFNIPFTDIPIYGYGLMLFLAYVFCTWLAGRLATRQGIDRRILSDMAIWLFVTGIIGARLTHVFIEQWDKYKEDPRRIL